jgi:glucokinase
MNNHPILAGDIGGTKTVLALYEPAGSLLTETTYTNNTFGSLQEVLTLFLAGNPSPARGCLGVAGPVHDNRVQMTNLDWYLDGNKLAEQFGLEQLLLVNDLVATTAGALKLPPESLVTVNSGQPNPNGACCVLAPGTGLGQSFAVPGTPFPFPSEGGHSSFAPRTDEQIELLKFLRRERPHVSVEQVCSGMAIPNLYRFAALHCPEPSRLKNQLAATGDKTPLIVQAANRAVNGGETCEPAVRAIHLFVDILAAETANLALKVLATGGVYIGGGMPPRLLDFFEPERFMAIFCRGVYREMLAAMPIHIIRDSKTALFGTRVLAEG